LGKPKLIKSCRAEKEEEGKILVIQEKEKTD
jgi:hypothetical protein